MKRSLILEPLTRSVIGAFYEVYNRLGFGFLESIYMNALERELRARGHRVAREVWVTVYYRREAVGCQRSDMVVDEQLIVEGKATLELRKDVRRQIYSYLHSTHLEVGLILHFGPEPRFYRVICTNKLRVSAESVVSASSG